MQLEEAVQQAITEKCERKKTKEPWKVEAVLLQTPHAVAEAGESLYRWKMELLYQGPSGKAITLKDKN